MDIEIFPHRVLGSDTTEKLLNDLELIDDVQRTVIHGPRFPKGEESLPDKYKERRVITINEIEEVCKKHIPFGFDINQDRSNYIRKHKTVSDKIKYGSAELPDELIGMTDQYSNFESHVNIIKRDTMD